MILETPCLYTFILFYKMIPCLYKAEPMVDVCPLSTSRHSWLAGQDALAEGGRVGPECAM